MVKTNTPDSNPSFVWKAHKAVISGVLIKHGACIKRQRSIQLTLLLDDLHKAEARHKHAQTPAGEAELLLLRAKITDIMQFRAKAAIQVCRRMPYESRDKCGRLLANSLKEQALANYIPHIMTSSGQKTTFPRNIAREFKEFYASLYNLQKPASSQTQIENYLCKSGLPKLPAEASVLLDEPISIDEIKSVVGAIKLAQTDTRPNITRPCYHISGNTYTNFTTHWVREGISPVTLSQHILR